jgi:hypothetical protein
VARVDEGFLFDPQKVSGLASEMTECCDELRVQLMYSQGWQTPLWTLGELSSVPPLHERLGSMARAMDTLITHLARVYEVDAATLFGMSAEKQRTDAEIASEIKFSYFPGVF